MYKPFLYLLPHMEKQLLLPAADELICSGGLLVAKLGYGAGEIRSSGVQNCQHGLQMFISAMLCATWYSLTDSARLYDSWNMS